MKSNPLLEEVWRIKDQLAAEAGYDVDRFFDNLRKWVAEHPHPGPVIHNAEELREYVAAEERKRADGSALLPRHDPPDTNWCGKGGVAPGRRSDPILEEVWRIKDQLAAEADYDADRFLENLRKWEAEHPHPGPVIRNAEELRQHVAEEERKRADASAFVLRDKPDPDKA